MADFEYFRAEESDQFSFFRIPKALFTEKEFASLSTDAKLLYGILLDRISLSKKNGWIDGDGYVYIIYTIAELQELLRMSHTTVTKLLYELDSVHGIGLIERYRQGNNRPSVIYVKNFVKRIRGKPVRYVASGTPETGNPDCKELEIRIARNWKSGTQKNRSPDCKNLDGNNTKINKTISHGLRLSQDHLRAALRRHSWQAALLRYLSGYVGWPRSAHDAAKRYLYILYGAMALATVKTVAHDHFAVGESLCAVRGM